MSTLFFILFLQDVSDLFGADLPVEGGVGGEFAWRDGPLLQALKAGHWIVFDEVGHTNLLTYDVLSQSQRQYKVLNISTLC